jgi:hypothetical protein
VTVTSTVPADPGGATAVRELALFTTNDAAAVEPNLTALAPVNPDPKTVTDVPPDVDPVLGLTAVTAGRAGPPNVMSCGLLTPWIVPVMVSLAVLITSISEIWEA